MDYTNTLNLDKVYIEYIKKRLDGMNYHFISLIIDKLVSFIECSFVDIQIILNSKSINDEKITKDFIDMLRVMERKFLHMLQVIDIAINLSEVNHYESYRQIANILVATFHDFGRILEIHKVGTKMGSNKVNHTTLGLSYLFDDSMERERIKEYLSEELYLIYRDLIYTGIAYHGTKDVPYGILSPLATSVVKDIRDADKLAVMSSFVDPNTDMDTVFHMPFEELAQIPIHDVTLKEIMSHKQIDRSNKDVPYDKMRQYISHIGFIYDINSPLLYDYLYLTHWVEKYIGHVRKYLRDENQDKMYEIEAECLDFLRKKQSHNINAGKLGYKVFQKK